MAIHAVHSIWSRVGIPLLAQCLLVSCASPAGVMGALDVSKLDMDPQKFMTIELRNDIEIRTAVIRSAATAMSRTRWLALQYVEQENRKGFVPDHESEYANLFLVRKVEGGEGDAGTIRERYLVIDLWHYYPREGIKTCHEWMVWEDDLNSKPTRGSFRLLLEDFNNVFLGERHAPLDARTVDLLGDFYLKVKGFFAQKVKDRRITATRASAGRPPPQFPPRTASSYPLPVSPPS